MTLHTKGGRAGAVILDLTAAYDNIWHTALLYKLSKCLPLRCIQTVELLLQNSHFRVHMGNDVSSWQRQANGLPHGSVLHLALTLFNLYTSDLPVTRSRRFIYADDICCALQVETFSEIVHSDSRSCQIQSAVASETQHVQDCDKCYSPA